MRDLQMDNALADILGNQHVSKALDLFVIHSFAQVLSGRGRFVGAHGDINYKRVSRVDLQRLGQSLASFQLGGESQQFALFWWKVGFHFA